MKENKLRARWSKRHKTIVSTYPLGISTNCDTNYLLSDIFNKEFINEMVDRGYDISTLKFEIKVDENAKGFEDKFPTLAKRVENYK